MNTTLAVIPGDHTSQLHPLDGSINKPFKNNMLEEWSKWMAEGRHENDTVWKNKTPINSSSL